MTATLSIREHGTLTTDDVARPSLDCKKISPPMLDWLCRAQVHTGDSSTSLVNIKSQTRVQLSNYVGVVEAPCGTILEVLPKHLEGELGVAEGRDLLSRMIATALGLQTKTAGEANLRLFKAPLSEWIIRQFLNALDRLLKRGINFRYERIEEEQRFLRGQLIFIRQARQRPERQHLFHIRYDVFSPDRPENRLLRLGLERVYRATRSSENWRLARELRDIMSEIPPSRNMHADLKLWSNDRLVAHYKEVKAWCRLILNDEMPIAVSGDWRGISFLFPMEKLFEKYAVACIRQALPAKAKLQTKPSNLSLCHHDGSPMFWLEPDMLLDYNAERWVLDTKWKLLNSSSKDTNYGVASSDIYQLLAYGKTYLRDHNGKLALIYPKHAGFDRPLPVFHLPDQLELWALPFDLERGEIIHSSLSGIPLQYSEAHDQEQPSKDRPNWTAVVNN